MGTELFDNFLTTTSRGLSHSKNRVGVLKLARGPRYYSYLFGIVDRLIIDGCVQSQLEISRNCVVGGGINYYVSLSYVVRIVK